MADNTYRSGEHLIQTAQTQCDCANTMRLRKHNATTQTQYIGDCSFGGIAKKAINVYKRLNVENPLKTGNAALDYAAGQIKPVKAWNTGFNAGKYGFIAKQTYDETCKRKKQNQSEYRRTDMNKTLANLLILGGVNHIISYIPLPQLINQIWSVLFIIFFVIILLKKNFSLFAPMQNKFSKITHYIEALGAVDYLIFLFGTVAGFIFGYISAQRQYNNEPPIDDIALAYFSCLEYAYYAALVVAFIWATYISFLKKTRLSV